MPYKLTDIISWTLTMTLCIKVLSLFLFYR